MRRALRLAARGWGRVAPNPLVGAVLVRDGEVVGEGWHAEHGAEHAEAAALDAAGERARGATLYVTLEPCVHTGKTPPCTDAIVGAGVRRVVVACRDSNREAAGGVARLREAGVQVETGVEAAAARRLNAPFLWRHATGEPFVTLKLALSLDARLAAAPERRSRVTGSRAWKEVHRLRAGADAVLVGWGTARADDPLLTARGPVAPRRPPLRVVLDRELRLAPDWRLAKTAEEAPVLVLTGPGGEAEGHRALRRAGVRVEEVPLGREGGLDLGAVFRLLAAEGVASVLVEGGGRLASSLLREGRVHRMVLLYAPLLFGAGGVEGFPDVPAVPRGEWRVAERRALGQDTLIVLEEAKVVRTLAEVS